MAMEWIRRLRRRVSAASGRGLLARLRADRRGNTLAIMAATIVPLAGMVGGGMDLSRMYITKTRMQHGCDAGALAGRRSMGAGNWASDDEATANRFFDANYQTGAYGSNSLVRTYTENAGRVTGNVSVVLPMTLMRVLGKNTETLTVTCEAQLQLPNTDVMFVLDTTGSMNCVAGDTSCTNNGGTPATGSKIDGLKLAVNCFYEALAQLNTVADCGSTPSGGTSSAVQIRFGFMPYSSNVNVGYLLPPSFFANNWNYQTRSRNGSRSAWSDWEDKDESVPRSGSTCVKPADTATKEYRYDSQTTRSGVVYCLYDTRFYGPEWNYGRQSVSITPLKNGTSWNKSFTLPIGDGATTKTITWDGCIEERPTVRQTDYSPIPATAYDLNIDLLPKAGDGNTLWGPALGDLLWYRSILGNLSEANAAAVTTANNYVSLTPFKALAYACPTEARALAEWDDPDLFSDYVDSLVANGQTYHDIGMLWGARFMSPTGIFAASNALAGNGGTIQRHMIYMTDGDASSNPCDYNAYGVPFYDQRQTTDVGSASSCLSKRTALVDQINARLEALCEGVKGKSITLWVVSYGGSTNAATEKRLEDCASPPDSSAPKHYFPAKGSSDLKDVFTSIANSISQLRLRK